MSDVIYNIKLILYKIEKYWDTDWFRCLIHLRNQEIEFNAENKFLPHPFEFIILGKTADPNDVYDFYDPHYPYDSTLEDPDFDIIYHIENSSGCVLAIKEKNAQGRKPKRRK